MMAPAAGAQVPTPAGHAPADDTPAIRIGVTLFFATTPCRPSRRRPTRTATSVTPTSFNIGRAYLNVTGQINHLIAFRVTPDIVRESGSGSSSAGSYVYRLKYAYGQFNLDDWMTRGTWARFGMQQTPWIDFIDTSTATAFRDRRSRTAKASCPRRTSARRSTTTSTNNYGDVHTGFYNGDNYNQPEANDQKAWMTRGTVRPLPASAALRGLRVTGFYNLDAYVKDGDKRRGIVAATYEHPYVNAGFNYLSTTDQRAAPPIRSSTATATRSGRRPRRPRATAGRGCCGSTTSCRSRRPRLSTASATAPSPASRTGSRGRAR